MRSRFNLFVLSPHSHDCVWPFTSFSDHEMRWWDSENIWDTLKAEWIPITRIKDQWGWSWGLHVGEALMRRDRQKKRIFRASTFNFLDISFWSFVPFFRPFTFLLFVILFSEGLSAFVSSVVAVWFLSSFDLIPASSHLTYSSLYLSLHLSLFSSPPTPFNFLKVFWDDPLLCYLSYFPFHSHSPSCSSSLFEFSFSFVLPIDSLVFRFLFILFSSSLCEDD